MSDMIQWAVTLAVGPASAVGGWFFARRQQRAVTKGLELENDGRAIDLYGQMTEIASGLQERLVSALAEIDAMRAQLQDCIEAREEAKRERENQYRQAQIDKARTDVEMARLRHELAELRLQVVALGEDGPEGN